ncbi:Hypothetical protein FKW44_015362, partial [Caligus rogercresseyi]
MPMPGTILKILGTILTFHVIGLSFKDPRKPIETSPWNSQGSSDTYDITLLNVML